MRRDAPKRPRLLDFLLGTILVVSVVTAARNGFTREVIRMAALVCGIAAALWGHGLLAQELGPWIQDGRVAAAVAFLGIFVGCLVAGALLARLLVGVWEWTGMRSMDILLGAGFGLVRGVLLCGVVLLVLLAFRPFSGTPRAVADSAIAPWVISVARTAILVAPEALREAFREGHRQVQQGRSSGAA